MTSSAIFVAVVRQALLVQAWGVVVALLRDRWAVPFDRAFVLIGVFDLFTLHIAASILDRLRHHIIRRAYV